MTTESLTDRLAAALRDARGFIRNGIEFGYIRMPDKDVPDTAHDTLPHIETALAAYDAARQRPEAAFDEPCRLTSTGWLIAANAEGSFVPMFSLTLEQKLILADRIPITARRQRSEAVGYHPTGKDFSYLPKITERVLEDLGESALPALIEIDSHGKRQWTQLAVDFCSLLSNHRHPPRPEAASDEAQARMEFENLFSEGVELQTPLTGKSCIRYLSFVRQSDNTYLEHETRWAYRGYLAARRAAHSSEGM